MHQLWKDGILSIKGIQKAIQEQDPETESHIISLINLDPMPKSWFLPNQENDDLDNPNRTERTEEEKYAAESESARSKINHILHQLQSKSSLKNPIKEKMKTIYFQQKGIEPHSMQPTFSKGQTPLDRAAIKDIYAQISTDMWNELQEISPNLVPDRLKLNPVLIDLYEKNTLFSRTLILDLARSIPLVYGVWHAMKEIFRKSIEQGDWEVFGALAARFENESHNSLPTRANANTYQCNPERYEDSHSFYSSAVREVPPKSIQWLTRRAWSVMRDIGTFEPEQYTFVAIEVLRSLEQFWGRPGWLVSHILQKEDLEICSNRTTFRYNAESELSWYNTSAYKTQTESRAFLALWKQELAPVLRLFETARSETIQEYAIRILNLDFQDRLSEIPLDFISRMIAGETEVGINLAYEWLSGKSGISQAEFVSKGAHIPTLALLKIAHEQGMSKATTFASEYIINHAPELHEYISTADMLWMLSQDHESTVFQTGAHLCSVSQYQSRLKLNDWTDIFRSLNGIRNKEGTILTFFNITKQKITEYIIAAEDYSWFYDAVVEKGLSDFATELITDGKLPKKDLIEFIRDYMSNPALAKDMLDTDVPTIAHEQSDHSYSYLNHFNQHELRSVFLSPMQEELISELSEESLDKLFSNMGMDFLKEIILPKVWRDQDWTNLLGTHGEVLRNEFDLGNINEPIGIIHRVSWNNDKYGLDQTSHNKIIRYLKEKVSIQEIGIDWVIEKSKTELSSDFDFIRSIAIKSLPINAWGEDGTKALIDNYKKTNTDSKYGRFLRKMIELRCERHRYYSDMDSIDKELELGHVSWDVVSSLFGSRKLAVRSLGIFFTKYYTEQYTIEASLGFAKLEPLFLSQYSDVSKFFIDAIDNADKEYGYFNFYAKDGDKDIFTTQELLPYLSHPDFVVRDLGVRIIKKHSTFANLNDLFALSNSTDRRVRELIVSQLWEQHRNRGITLHWKPFAQSRVPQSPTIRRPVKVRTTLRSGLNHVSEQHTKEWVIGPGVEESEHQDESTISFAHLKDFMSYVLFRLPPTMPLISQSRRFTKATNAWQNKKSLIEAISHVAQQNENREFADMVLPIFVQLLESDSKTEREALLVAVTKIKRAHSIA